MFNFKTFRSERFRRLSNEGFWIVLGQAMAVIGSLFGVRLLTGLLTPAVYGELALGMTVATLVNQTVLGPLGNGVIRFYAPAQERGDLGNYLKAARRLVFSATGIIVLMILITVTGLLIAGETKLIAIAIAALIFAIFSGYNSILSGIQNAARQRAIVAIHQGIDPWARFLVAAGLILCLGATSAAAMVGYTMASVLVLGSQLIFFRKIDATTINGTDKEKIWLEKMWTFSWPISIFGIFTCLQLVSDRWALKFFSTTQEVGLYAVLYQLGYYPMTIATGIAMQLLVPIFYQRAGDANDKSRNENVSTLCWRITWLTLGITGSAFLIAFLFHRLIFRFFVAEEYATVSYLLPWMLFAGGVFAAGQTVALFLQSQMKMREMMPAKIITALLGVFLNFVGAYWYGTLGIVFASVLFSVSYFIWMVVLSKHTERKLCL